METGEMARTPTLLLLLDGAKASDKVQHGPLFAAQEPHIWMPFRALHATTIVGGDGWAALRNLSPGDWDAS
eukprot:104503-Prorocentrum_lima.AAC.1